MAGQLCQTISSRPARWNVDHRGHWAPICCSGSVAPSTTAHSVPGLAIDLPGSLMRTRPLLMRHDPPRSLDGPEGRS
jgi:hypothetical protein